MGMKEVDCQYYKCDKIGKSYNEPYCPLHLDMVKKMEHRVRNPNRKRVCLYPECGTILTSLNDSYFCYLHHKRVVFEMAGLNPDKAEELDVSQVNQEVEKVLYFEKRRVRNEAETIS